jgi:guanidinopropionase
MAQNLKKTNPASREQRLEAYQPLSGMVLPRFAGISTFMRLPHLSPTQAPGEIDIAILGIPFDGATTNRPGARLGPRQVREASSLMRLVNYGTLVAPYDLCACADVGDVPINPIDVVDTLRRIEAEISYLHQGGVTPLSIGGDHIISYPILRALATKGPVGMIHVDAHSDTGDTFFGGQKLTHGTPFRRAIEDGVLDPKRMVQIGIRGTMYSTDERQWALDQGIRIIDMEEVAEKGIPYAIAEARRVVGMEPTYFTFDIDSIDPAFAPGTGTPEIGGFTSREALQLVRGFRHLNLIGADMVEVSPPLDQSGNTALVGASIAFELLCLLTEARTERSSKDAQLSVV